MAHGDDQGLRLPPVIAPTQAVIVPIWRKEHERELVEAFVERVVAALQPELRIFVDRRDDKTPGWKFNEWELRGVPVRIEVGPRDVQNEQVVTVRRDNRAKTPVPLAELQTTVTTLLGQIQAELFTAAKDRLVSQTVRVATLEELYERAASNAGFSIAGWCGDAACEARIKAESKATIRCLPFDQPDDPGFCIACGAKAIAEAVFARAY
jgi:prolyl-tRNA synthetase